GGAPAHDTGDVDNVAFMNERFAAAQAAIARGDAPATAASPMYNLDHAIGDANDAIEYVQRLAAAGVEELMCLFNMSRLTQDQPTETFRLWGEKVIPQFR